MRDAQSAPECEDRPALERQLRVGERFEVGLDETDFRAEGAERHVFIKLHTHGAQDPTLEALLGGGLSNMWTELERRYAQTPGYELRYVSCWEMVGVIRALALGEAK